MNQVNSIKNENLNKSSAPVVYCQLANSINESIYTNGLADGTEGVCKEQDFSYPYYVKGDSLFVTRRAGTVEYKIHGDYLINLNGKTGRRVPSKNSSGIYEDGGYVRDDDLIAISTSYTGFQPSCFLIYDNTFYIACDIIKDKAYKINEINCKMDKSYIKKTKGIKIKTNQQENNDSGNWGIGLMALSGLLLVVFGLQGGFSAVLLIAFAIGFFKWFWFS